LTVVVDSFEFTVVVSDDVALLDVVCYKMESKKIYLVLVIENNNNKKNELKFHTKTDRFLNGFAAGAPSIANLKRKSCCGVVGDTVS